jgi:hypothetical protein
MVVQIGETPKPAGSDLPHSLRSLSCILSITQRRDLRPFGVRIRWELNRR